ncbi:unnamed protein product [Lymnaea stagnalis]|uniref:Uncharacterized protein n=1 Tax=Lymnaea stagnalis TaxID=6523 RepID=A0AAV2IE84_LYMST
MNGTVELALCFIVLCVQSKVASQTIKAFQSYIEDPACRKYGVAREGVDIVKFTARLDVTDNVDLNYWHRFMVMHLTDDNPWLLSGSKIVANILLGACNDFVLEKRKTPVESQTCSRDPRNKHWLNVDIATWTTAKFNMTKLTGLWYNRHLKYVRANIVIRYPIVIEAAKETLMVDSDIMPGKSFLVSVGSNAVLKYCVTRADRRITTFGYGGTLLRQEEEDADNQCLSITIKVTTSDLYRQAYMSFGEVQGTCLMFCTSSANLLQAMKSKLGSQSSARGSPGTSLDLVLSFLILAMAVP